MTPEEIARADLMERIAEQTHDSLTALVDSAMPGADFRERGGTLIRIQQGLSANALAQCIDDAWTPDEVLPEMKRLLEDFMQGMAQHLGTIIERTRAEAGVAPPPWVKTSNPTRKYDA